MNSGIAYLYRDCISLPWRSTLRLPRTRLMKPSNIPITQTKTKELIFFSLKQRSLIAVARFLWKVQPRQTITRNLSAYAPAYIMQLALALHIGQILVTGNVVVDTNPCQFLLDFVGPIINPSSCVDCTLEHRTNSLFCDYFFFPRLHF